MAWTKNIGPCGCCGSGITVPCCPGGVPARLSASFTNGTGVLAHLSGMTVPVVYDPASGRWEGSRPPMACETGDQPWWIECVYGSWGAAAQGLGTSQGAVTCSPFYLPLTWEGACGGPAGFVTVAVTE